MTAAVLAVYLPPRLLTGRFTLEGLDYWQVHVYRIEYARRFLFHWPPLLPAWNTREFFGSPFWANLHNFPWVPVRLILLPLDPALIFPAGVLLAAALSALLSFAYGRRVGFSPAASGLLGWTYACSGFFASKVMMGYLPHLESFPFLPLFLLLVERLPASAASGTALVPLALASAFAALCGHPQLPFYSLVLTVVYLVYRRGIRGAARPLLAMGAGLLLAGFAWGPMLSLIGRSTRVLPLETADNDVAFPLGRLWGYLRPWMDGWPESVARFPHVPFTGYPNNAYFWDTVVYCGILPLAAAGVLTALLVRKRRTVHPLWPFFLAAGAIALATALPFRQHFLSLLPGTYLRSPARQAFVTTFSLAFALAAWVDRFLKDDRFRSGMKMGAVGLAALLHLADLGRFDASFVRLIPREGAPLPSFERILDREADGARVGVDYYLRIALNRTRDDAGFFDTLVLASTYRTVMALSHSPPSANHEFMRASFLQREPLAFLGVRFVVTHFRRDDLRERGAAGNLRLYEVPGPAPFAVLYPSSFVRRSGEEGYLAAVRARTPVWTEGLTLIGASGVSPGPNSASRGEEAPSPVTLRRPVPDRMEATVTATGESFLRVLEARDPGWRAFVDGEPVPVLAAENCFMAVRIPPGRHEVRWEYGTPGKIPGALASGLGGALLLGLCLL
jgi:hypothetical protein